MNHDKKRGHFIVLHENIKKSPLLLHPGRVGDDVLKPQSSFQFGNMKEIEKRETRRKEMERGQGRVGNPKHASPTRTTRFKYIILISYQHLFLSLCPVAYLYLGI